MRMIHRVRGGTTCFSPSVSPSVVLCIVCTVGEVCPLLLSTGSACEYFQYFLCCSFNLHHGLMRWGYRYLQVRDAEIEVWAVRDLQSSCRGSRVKPSKSSQHLLYSVIHSCPREAAGSSSSDLSRQQQSQSYAHKADQIIKEQALFVPPNCLNE